MLDAAPSPVPSPAMTPSGRPHFLDVFHDVLFRPFSLFRTVSENMEARAKNYLFFYGVLCVLFVSALGPLLRFMEEGGSVTSLLFLIPVKAMVGFSLWLLMGLFISLLA